MGTTVATNALLERKGDRTLFVTTEGFGDVLRIGYQNRPRLFDRHIVLPEMLYERAIEVAERVSAEGAVITPLDLEGARAALKAAYDDGIRAVAIAFMHGYRFPDHEKQVRSEEHTSELQSLMRISYAVFCLTKTTIKKTSIYNQD